MSNASPPDINPDCDKAKAAAHTPKPWQLLASRPESDGVDCWTLLAQPHPGLRGFTRELAILAGPQADENARANAHLIASAPDLLEALKWIEYHYANQDMSHGDFRVEAYSRALAAIQRAGSEQ